MSDPIPTLISPEARIGRNVLIGHGTRVHASAVIEDDCQIGDFCIIAHPAGGQWTGRPLRIGKGSTIRSHSVIYEGSEFGPRLETGHHVLIREGTIAGENLRLGSFSDIEGDCALGDFNRLHSYVHVGRRSRIGSFNWLYSLATLTNDPLPPSDNHEPVTIEDGCVVAVGATLMPGVVLRHGSFISAHSSADGEIPVGAVVSGHPGRIVSHVSLLCDLAHGVRHPWMGHFAHAYPAHAQARIEALRQAIMASRKEFSAR